MLRALSHPKKPKVRSGRCKSTGRIEAAAVVDHPHSQSIAGPRHPDVDRIRGTVLDRIGHRFLNDTDDMVREVLRHISNTVGFQRELGAYC
jgi:hypothetical protein